MRHQITSIEPRSVAQRFGLCAGDYLISLNGEPVIDEIDYQALIAGSRVKAVLERGGAEITIDIRKQEGEPLGLHFADTMALSPRTCHNNCVFCFISQMPPNRRETLYVKDDDWRYSLMMGNFVTLTNVSDQEFDRIIRRKASPLYISVHTTNPELRCRMMNNRFAGDIMQKLTRLKNAGIKFHCQIVTVPGWNDGEELMCTLRDLRSLAPAAQTVAMVPVGLTKFRDGLEPLRCFTPEEARGLIDMIAPFQQECRETLGTAFAFPSDEFYCQAGYPIPPEDWYEDFPQIENGVGPMRQFETALEEAERFEKLWGEGEPAEPKTYVIPTGKSIAPHLQRWADRYAPKGVKVRTIAVPNHFFGETVTVTGLLTGGDILAALTSEAIAGADEILLCSVTLRHERDLFLDDMHIDEFRTRAPLPVHLTDCDGQAFYDALRGRFDE